MAYATVTDLKAHINKTLDVDDPVIQQALDRASELVDRTCNREVGGFQAQSVATARGFAGSGNGVIWISEAVEITLVEGKDSRTDPAYVAWASTDWQAASGNPRRPDFNRTPYRFLLIQSGGDYSQFIRGGRGRYGDSVTPTVQVTARWGYADNVPGPIAQAVIIQAARWFKRGQGAYGDALSTGEFGQMFFTKKLDPDIANILENGRYIVPSI